MTTGFNLDAAGLVSTTRLASPLNTPQAKGASQAEIRQAAQEFEARFITEMLKPIFDTIPTDGPFGGGHGEEMMRGLMLEELGKDLAAGGGFGLADAVARQLIITQEQQLQAMNDLAQSAEQRPETEQTEPIR